jgi:hypothetical protein
MILLTLLLQAELALEKQKDRVLVKAGSEVLAHYVFDDPAVHRPFLAHVRAPGGPQVTRAFPPVEGKDATDHATMHPGIWLGFGDLGGTDFWRNKGRVVAESVEVSGSTITAKLAYRDGGRLACRETSRVSFERRPEGLAIALEASFASDAPFAFGDQEEMGLGVRLATPLAVKAGGRILDSAGRKNEREVWGKTADWADYGGSIDGRRAGLLVVPHPSNFRPSWMHARDYGVLVANPFGRKAFTKSEPSRVEVKPGETFRLRFAVLAYAGEIDAAALARTLRD